MREEQASVEVLVLMDGERTYYLVPRTVLERSRASEEQRPALEQALGSELHGHLAGVAASSRVAASTARAGVRFAPVGLLRLAMTAFTGLGTALSSPHAPRQGAGGSVTAQVAAPRDTGEGERS